MKVIFINVGYGDSILLENPIGNEDFVILVDGGKPEEEHYNEFLQRIKTIDYLKQKGISRINLLIITHLHEDHVGGLLEVVKAMDVDEMWCNYTFPDELLGKRLIPWYDYCEGARRLLNSLNIYNEICCILRNKGKKLKEIRDITLNQQIACGICFDIFGPEDHIYKDLKDHIEKVYFEDAEPERQETLDELDHFINNTSLVLRVIYGDKRILLAGDVYNTYWKNILEHPYNIQANLLKLPHHGHLDSISEKFVRAVEPENIVISVSNNRPDNCPHPEVIKLIGRYCKNEKRKVEIFFTDAVNMLPYSTKHTCHKAVIFSINDNYNISSYYETTE